MYAEALVGLSSQRLDNRLLSPEARNGASARRACHYRSIVAKTVGVP